MFLPVIALLRIYVLGCAAGSRETYAGACRSSSCRYRLRNFVRDQQVVAFCISHPRTPIYGGVGPNLIPILLNSMDIFCLFRWCAPGKVAGQRESPLLRNRRIRMSAPPPMMAIQVTRLQSGSINCLLSAQGEIGRCIDSVAGPDLRASSPRQPPPPQARRSAESPRPSG